MDQAELEAEDNASESAEINSCLARKIRESVIRNTPCIRGPKRGVKRGPRCKTMALLRYFLQVNCQCLNLAAR